MSQSCWHRGKLLMENEPVYKDVGLETTKGNLSSVKWADLSDNNEMFNLDGHDPQPLFDRIFSQAGKSWVARGYISAPVAPALAKDDSFLRKIYQQTPVERPEMRVKKASEEMVTKTPVTTAQITVNFVSRSADLSPAAKQTLDR